MGKYENITKVHDCMCTSIAIFLISLLGCLII